MVESSARAPLPADLVDARRFPVDLQVEGGRYAFLWLDDAVLAESTFLDTRLDIRWPDAVAVEAAAIPASRSAPAPAWLFHTSFCGSTLLARALHLPPHQVCLKEPLVLRRLSDARDAGVSVAALVETTVQLLARPWHAGGRVVVKPTHAALNMAASLMDATPSSRAIVLTSSLEDFLVSNLKKTPESQARIPELTERAMRAGRFHARLPAAAMQPPDILCAAGLQWAAQRELVGDLADTFGDRLRILDMAALLGRFEDTVARCAAWLQLSVPRDALDRHCQAVLARNAKAVETPYGPGRRQQEAEFVNNHYAAALDHAKAWLAEHVIPAMRPAACAPPASWYLP